jgi:hypothetical protein
MREDRFTHTCNAFLAQIRTGLSTGLGPILFTALWMTMNIAWIHADLLPRDGDEEGHVGAAELFLSQLQGGDLLGWLDMAWRGQVGEYPPLVPALVGAWWWLTGAGLPGDTLVRGLNLLAVLVAAGATARLAARSAPAAAPLAWMGVLCLPLLTGLGRHFMPELWVAAWVPLTLLLAVRAQEQPGRARAILLGLAIGLGLLTKQTFLLVAGAPLAALLWPLGRRAGVALGVAAAVAGPWMLANLDGQLSYLAASAGSAGPDGWLGHLAYYPQVMVWVGLGPALFAGLILAALASKDPPDRRTVALAGLWLLGGLLILTLLPKKYPRLLTPLMPAAVLWFAVSLHSHRRTSWGVIMGAAAWLGWASTHPVPPPPAVDAQDPGCTQVWLRPPVADDLGLGAVAAALQGAPPGTVHIRGDAPIPCALQTTHAWSHHLGPHLRRSGDDRGTTQGPTAPAGTALIVDWTGEARGGRNQGIPVHLPALDRSFVLGLVHE